MAELTITKCLSDLKLLDKRINRGIYNGEFVGHTVGQNKKVNHTEVEEFKNNVKNNYESVKDLISRRNKIKSAIVSSNAKTEVTVAGEKYTVAEAIERKTSIAYEEELLGRMKQNLANESNTVDRVNDRVKESLDGLLESMFSGESKRNKEGMEAFTESYNRENKAELVDPLGIKKVIEELEANIEDFLSEVDEVLSVSNATTVVEIED